MAYAASMIIKLDSFDFQSKGETVSSHRPIKRPRLDVAHQGEPSLSGRSLSKSDAGHITAPDPATVINDDAKEKKRKTQLAEFLSLMGPRTKSRAWDNDQPDQDQDQTAKLAVETKRNGEQTLPGPMSHDVEMQPENMSDLEWMKSRMKRKLADENDRGENARPWTQPDEEQVQDEIKPPDVRIEPLPLNQNNSEKDVAQILSTGRLFLRNLTFSVTDKDIREAFGKYGDIQQVHIPLDPDTRQPKGVAYVRFVTPEHALMAYQEMDGRDLQGRLVHIIPAVEKAGSRIPAEDSQRRKSLKEVNSAKRVATAGKDFNWAMLYMNSDAVAASVADRLKISKGDILNAETGTTNPAVKLALAETHIINETKKYLEDNGIILDSSQTSTTRSAPRSNTTILVKNIPYGTSVEDLQSMFNMHGEIVRLLLPPAGTLAVVDFEHTHQAAKAFKALAYKRLGSTIMYLEWAPVWLFSSDTVGEGSGAQPAAVAKQPQGAEEIQPGAADQLSSTETVNATGSTLFVKNLNFSTTSERLVSAFKGLPGFAFARVNTKPDPKNPNARLSMGYGFAGFTSPSAAQGAMKTMQGFILDSHMLQVTFAERGADDNTKGVRAASSLGKSKMAKLIVKNLPFEASKKDIQELFGAYGTLKSVRLPRKFDTKTRGFAFLEFISRHEAENAMATLKHTHLLGRHLVLDWAEENDVVDVDNLREKIRKGYVEDGKAIGGQQKKLKIGAGQDEEDDGMMEV
ncbi:Multiple RNA-binding domain-containing protein 1 [Tulasnella sp. JGI-2019a]|nr:Multiple RNA-binding domain-containing protein 1 [Tulasnella sp. JGI-2019a]